MNEEIKEIFDYFKKYMSIKDCIKVTKIEYYINNLQHENEQLLMENITIKSLSDLVDETIYKSRVEKAVEYIKNCPEYLWANVNTKELLNILNGKGSDE